MTIEQTLSLWGVLPKCMQRGLQLRRAESSMWKPGGGSPQPWADPLNLQDDDTVSKTLAFNKRNRKDINNTKGRTKERWKCVKGKKKQEQHAVTVFVIYKSKRVTDTVDFDRCVRCYLWVHNNCHRLAHIVIDCHTLSLQYLSSILLHYIWEKWEFTTMRWGVNWYCE